MKRILILTSVLWSFSALAQTIGVMPQNVSGIGSIQVGNAIAGKCDGLSPNFVKLSIQPSCYGQNLRSGGETLNPDHGDVELDLSINNGGSNFNTKITFPNKVTWPENYGQTCKWSGSKPFSTADCDQQGKIINYSCKAVQAPWFLDDYLSCERNGDPLAHGELNKKVTCGFLYTWKGTNYAAVNSYTKIGSVANCALRDSSENWGNKMTITSSTPANKVTKYAKRGKIVVAFDGLNIKKQSVVKDNTTGKFITSGSRSQVLAKFYQFAPDGTRKNLSQRVEASFDEFEECLEVKAAFLGANQFCGSFYSPIMLFFDDQLPQFAGTSTFPLVEGVKMIYWPESKAPGYFLALDEYDTQKITSNKQLFGENKTYKNGFDALKRIDSNNDGVIDSKDKLYSKLVLWKDINGDGVSDKGELFTLESQGVVSLSLKYNDKERKSFGKRAEAREASEFSFMKNGKEEKGKILDIWLAPNAMANKKK
jgi:hypothetical protein